MSGRPSPIKFPFAPEQGTQSHFVHVCLARRQVREAAGAATGGLFAWMALTSRKLGLRDGLVAMELRARERPGAEDNRLVSEKGMLTHDSTLFEVEEQHLIIWRHAIIRGDRLRMIHQDWWEGEGGPDVGNNCLVFVK